MSKSEHGAFVEALGQPDGGAHIGEPTVTVVLEQVALAVYRSRSRVVVVVGRVRPSGFKDSGTPAEADAGGVRDVGTKLS